MRPECVLSRSSNPPLYNPALGLWLSAGTPGTLRFNHTATLLRNGKVLVTGGGSTESGTDALATTELYDPATGTGTWTNTGGMSTARRFHTATLLNNCKVLIVGGNNGGNGQVLVTGGAGTSVPLSATAELYDPTTNTWSNTGRMTKPRRDHSATRLTDGKVLVAGGFHEGTGIQGNAELYDPATGAWSETLSMKVPRYQHTATLLPDGNVLVVAGVNNQNTPFAEFYVP